MATACAYIKGVRLVYKLQLLTRDILGRMDEELTGSDEEPSPPNGGTPAQSSPPIFELTPGIMASVHRILDSPQHRASLMRGAAGASRIAASAHFRDIHTRLAAAQRTKDDARVLPMREAISDQRVGASSERLPGTKFHQYIDGAKKIIADDDSRAADAERDPRQDAARQTAVSILDQVASVAAVDDPDYTAPTLNFSFLEITSIVTSRMEQQLRQADDADTYMAGRQLLSDAIVMAADAFNVAALDETMTN